MSTEVPSPSYVLFKLAELTTEVHQMPNSREKSVILTKLDEARHWARDLDDRTPKTPFTDTDLPPYIGVEHN